MDYFLDDQNCTDRLFEEWKKYGSLIIAYDFDNTVFDYYNKGYTFTQVIDLLRKCYDLGFHLIVFTSCEENRYAEIQDYLRTNNIPFHAINETPSFIPFQGRKVYFNVLLDDRAGLSAAYKQLKNTVYSIYGYKITI
jgi:adenosine deaminase